MTVSDADFNINLKQENNQQEKFQAEYSIITDCKLPSRIFYYHREIFAALKVGEFVYFLNPHGLKFHVVIKT
jgi:hypothetical protein